MKKVVVITTGGTIASRADPTGAQVAVTHGADLLRSVPRSQTTDVAVRDLLTVNSYGMTMRDMDDIRCAVNQALQDPSTDGVVVTHGTDTLEETALLVSLYHSDSRPVVFTGAQRSADDSDSDGPANLDAAIGLAGSPSARDLGVLIIFNGVVHSARGARKTHTAALSAFSDPDFGPLGFLRDGELVLQTHLPKGNGPLGLPVHDLSSTRVDIVALYPGVSDTALDAYVTAGAQGLVLEATGIGNTNADVVRSVAKHVSAGIRVIISTRVNAGPIRPVYGGGGGGHDLINAGAISAGYLRPSQARIQLAALLACEATEDHIRQSFLPDTRGPETNTSSASEHTKESQ